MQSSNLVAGSAVFRCDEHTSSNHAPETSGASTAWWPGLTVNSLDQGFPCDSSYSPEFSAAQNSGHQYHVNDNTALQNIPGNPISSHSETADDRTFLYPQVPWYPPPGGGNLARAYISSQYGQPLLHIPGNFPSSLQAMTSQPLTEPLPIVIPPQEQPALPECAWTEDGKRCGYPLLDDTRKLGMHLREFHSIQGNDKKGVTCFWEGCNRKLQRGAIVRHIGSCHLKTRWTCRNCLKHYSRRDAMQKHAKDCQAAGV